MKRLLSISALGSLLVALLFMTAQPARAGVDERIQALEQELSELKAEQEQLKGEQMELRKEATTAAAKMPTFSYRGGSGILMQAADKSWSIRFRNRIHYWIMFRDGKNTPNTEREGDGELFARRIRPTFFYCVNNCFYEMEAAMDWDSGDAISLQRAAAYIHFEQINPWLPTWIMGIDAPTEWIRRRSSSSGAQLDYDMLSRSLGNTFSQGWAYGLLWEDLPLGSIGIPGEIGWFNVMVGSGPGNASDGDFGHVSFVNSDAKSYVVSLGVAPFSETKSKWIQGLELSWGAWFCNFIGDREDDSFHGIDHTETANISQNGGCDDASIRETEGPERAVMWDADVDRGALDGRGTHRMHGVALRHRIGPYQLLVTGQWFVAEDVLVRHRNWNISHELFIWSPKGFMTGSASTPGSILVGTHFERSDAKCGGTPSTCNNGGEFTNNYARLVSAHVSYFIQRGLRVGVHWNHYDAHKLRTGVQEDLDIRSTGVVGRGGDWDNVMLIFGWEF